jgi:hypothetical protein
MLYKPRLVNVILALVKEVTTTLLSNATTSPSTLGAKHI